MDGLDRARRAPGDQGGGRSNLLLRVLSGMVLAPLAIGAAAVGGLPFLLFCALAAIGIWWEWASLSAGEAARRLMTVGGGSLAAAAIFLAAGWLGTAFACVAGGTVVVAASSWPQHRAWVGAGVVYAGVMLIAPVLLRADPVYGFVAILFLFAVVWTTDILAYFAGRAIGGPKLAPRLSPNKTWSGAIAGAAGAVIAAAAVAVMAGLGSVAAVALVGAVLSVASQAGDLFESAVKRLYGAKDAGKLIPGHGGLMDRLDGFIAAAVVAAALGLLRSGAEAPARGLLVW